MIVLETCFLLLFWGWVLCAFLFVRQTVLPRLPISVTPAHLHLPFESVRFQATDGVWLSGWTMSDDARQPWIILCHGLGTNRADLLEVAHMLIRAHYNVLAFDFRAHGESDGWSTSFGWQEQRDLEGALAFLGQQPEVADQPYGLYGVSMGGSVALMVASRDERLAAVAVDSAYADLEASLAHHLRLLYHLPKIPFLLFLNAAYRLRFGAWPTHMSPIRQISQISPRPLFIIHGSEDPRTPVQDAQRLAEAATEPKSLWIAQGAGHLAAAHLEPESYARRLIEFFDSCLRQPLKH